MIFLFLVVTAQENNTSHLGEGSTFCQGEMRICFFEALRSQKRLMAFYLEEIIQAEFWEFCLNDASVDD